MNVVIADTLAWLKSSNIKLDRNIRHNDITPISKTLVRRNVKFEGVHLTEVQAQKLEKYLQKLYGNTGDIKVTPSTRRGANLWSSYYCGMRVRFYDKRNVTTMYFENGTNKLAKLHTTKDKRGCDEIRYVKPYHQITQKRVPVEDFDELFSSLSIRQQKLYLKANINKKMHC